MKIIVGLGNPGKKYANTRHNVGFLGLDKIIEKVENKSLFGVGVRAPALTRGSVKAGALNGTVQQPFKLEKRFEAEIAKLKIGNEDIILVKPQTFMNLSGIAVRKVVDFYKINPKKDLIVVCDDIDLALGKVRVKTTGSSAGHNGVQSIIDNLGMQDFIRVRIGIGRPENALVKIEDWVLQALNEIEKEVIFNSIGDLIMQGIGYI